MRCFMTLTGKIDAVIEYLRLVMSKNEQMTVAEFFFAKVR